MKIIKTENYIKKEAQNYKRFEIKNRVGEFSISREGIDYYLKVVFSAEGIVGQEFIKEEGEYETRWIDKIDSVWIDDITSVEGNNKIISPDEFEKTLTPEELKSLEDQAKALIEELI